MPRTCNILPRLGIRVYTPPSSALCLLIFQDFK